MANEKLIDIVGLEEFKDKLETVYQPLNTRLTNIASVSTISGGFINGFLKITPSNNSVILDGTTYLNKNGDTLGLASLKGADEALHDLDKTPDQISSVFEVYDGSTTSPSNNCTLQRYNGFEVYSDRTAAATSAQAQTRYGLNSIYHSTGGTSMTLTFPTDGGVIATRAWVQNSAVPTMKTLNTAATTTQSISSSETLTGSGTITLHKVSKTGKYTDLIDKPTLGSAASKDTGTTAGTVPILGIDGKLDTSVLPAIAITDTFVVSSQSAMLALDAQVGDVAVRTDINKSFILKEDGASTLSHWQELLTPTDAVTSVNGKTGAVTLTAADVSAVRYDTASQGLSSAQQSNARTNIGAMSASADLTTMGYSIATPAEIDALFA